MLVIYYLSQKKSIHFLLERYIVIVNMIFPLKYRIFFFFIGKEGLFRLAPHQWRSQGGTPPLQHIQLRTTYSTLFK
jgi:hypothetical protein